VNIAEKRELERLAEKVEVLREQLYQLELEILAAARRSK